MPNMGLKLTEPRSRVVGSTDGASWVPLYSLLNKEALPVLTQPGIRWFPAAVFVACWELAAVSTF